MTEQTNRDKMLQRVLNLRAKADNDGSSEAEMMTAFSVAAKLMASYNIEEAELALAESQGRITLDIVHKDADTNCAVNPNKKVQYGRKLTMHKVIFCNVAIARFTNTKCIRNPYSGVVTFTGHRPDAELANYLVGVCRDAMDREFDNYKRSVVSTGYGAKTSFQYAMATRISERLNELSAAAEKERADASNEAKLKIADGATDSSTALVVSELMEQKVKEVDAAYKKANPRVSTTKSYTRVTNGTAQGAGRKAGSRVNFNKAVGKSSSMSLA